MNLRRDVFQAIADPTRRAILTLVAANAMTAGAIAANFDTARPTVSKHLQILTECELLKQEQNGRGIAHSERFEDPAVLANGGLEMIQTWVALPEKDEEAAPSFNNYTPEQLREVTDKGVWMRLIAGDAYGLKSDVQTSSPMFYVHAVLDKGAAITLPREHAERGVYVTHGEIEVNGIRYDAGKFLVFQKNAERFLLSTFRK